MTRDQAIDIAKSVICKGGVGPGDVVTILEKLGLLKLEEPKTATEKATEVINSMIATYGGLPRPGMILSSRTICEQMEAAGLRIVDKS